MKTESQGDTTLDFIHLPAFCEDVLPPKGNTRVRKDAVDMHAMGRRNDADPSAKRAPTRVAARKSGGKTRLQTLHSLDGRTYAARKTQQLILAIEGSLGPDQLTAQHRELIKHAAVLGAMIESDEASWLAGKTIDVTSLLAAINTQRRLLLALGLRNVPRDITPEDLDSIELEGEDDADDDQT